MILGLLRVAFQGNEKCYLKLRLKAHGGSFISAPIYTTKRLLFYLDQVRITVFCSIGTLWFHFACQKFTRNNEVLAKEDPE